MLNTYAGCLFDLDGTLVDWRASVEEFLPRQFERFRPQLAPVTEAEYRAAFLRLASQGYTHRGRLYRAMVTQLAVSVPPDALLADFRTNLPECARLFPDALAVLHVLRERGARLAIVTNGSEQLQRGKIRTLGLDALVDAVLISEREGLRKPEPELFHRALQRIGTPPTALFIGDDPEADIIGAARAGLATAWLAHGREWPLSLTPGPDYRLTALSELMDAD